jgi:NAD(P)-dependent dehydrogenase (short-subunit alcohol dehydrogenase family)
VDRTVARFGRLDAAVNNTGTEGKSGPVTEQSRDSFAATFDTNVLGTVLGMKHEMRIMLEQGHGSIINVSSTYGHKGAAGASIYTASKHAVEGLTKSAAIEGAAFNVRVNAVAPGPVETGMLNRFTGISERKAGLVATAPLQHTGTPKEIAHAVLFLASPPSSPVTCSLLTAASPSPENRRPHRRPIPRHRPWIISVSRGSISKLEALLPTSDCGGVRSIASASG